MPEYSLTVTNNSTHSDYLMIFQNDPGSFAPDAMALAWVSKYSNPDDAAVVSFQWTIDWGFSWSDVGSLQHGVTYIASDQRPANTTTNAITLSYNGAYELIDQTAGTDPNLFYIKEDHTIPVASSAAVGITMAGKTVYAVQARPNQNLTFSPHPTYFLAYGDYAPGTVLDLNEINNPLEIVYHPGVYNLTVKLNDDDSWGPLQTQAQANMSFLAARKAKQQMHQARA